MDIRILFSCGKNKKLFLHFLNSKSKLAKINIIKDKVKHKQNNFWKNPTKYMEG